MRDHIKGIISSPELKFVPIILVLNKCDLVEKAEGEGGSASAFGARIKEIEESLGVAELRATYGSRLETLATSMKEVAGAKRLLDLAASYRRGAPVQRPSSAAPSATASTSRPASAGREKGTGTLASDSRAPSGDGKVEASHTRKSGSEKQGGRVDSHSRQNHAAEGVDGTALGSRDTADPNIPP